MKHHKPLLSLLVAAALGAATIPLSAAEASPLDLARQLNKAFVQVAQKVSPSVVVIRVKQKVESPRRTQQQNPFFDWFREQFPDRFPEPRGRSAPEEFERNGQGSGVIIRADGYIATNSHVVEDADEVTVILHDGRRYEGKIRGVDPQSDLAVIKIEEKGLTACKFADSNKAMVGEFAIAIGAPFELDYSVTIGHISAKGRAIQPNFQLVDSDFIQTDASINPGNSGGPLVNLDGDIVGINTMIRGIGTGIGFAIPANLAHDITDTLIADGKVTRAWLGISINSLREDATLRQNYQDLKDGVVVMDIVADGPAAESDLKVGDAIISVDGAAVRTVQGLKDEIRPKKEGSPVKLDVFRDGKKLVVEVSPGKRPGQTELYGFNRREEAKPESRIGVSVESITPKIKREYDLDTASGVLVTDVGENSIAARAGIAPGDVITHVNRSQVGEVKDFREALRDADLREGVVLKIVSDGSRKLRVLRSE